MNILQELRSRFARVLVDFTDDPRPFAEMVKPAQDPRFGDFQANCAMPLARQNGTNPRELALRIVDKLNVTDVCTPPEVAGPGFINLTLRDEWLAAQVDRAARDERLGVDAAGNPRRVVIDFSSPNVAKPMHVGHLRSTVIGAALARILEFLGHKTVTDNHIGDWGTQFGMIIYGYKNFVDQAAYERDSVSELARLYRLVNQISDYHAARAELAPLSAHVESSARALERAESAADPHDKQQKKSLKKQRAELGAAREELQSTERKIAVVENDPELMQLAGEHPHVARRAREETAKLHAGDPENRRLWNEFLPKCLAALETIYLRLGIRFDLTLGESFYDPMLADVVRDLEEKGIAVVSDGAKCVFIEGNDAPFIVQKADGAYTYATTDLATIRYRIEELQAGVILYVVDARQGEHFKLLFATVRKWGYTGTELEHVSFGTVMGKDRRPYKTRSGDTVGLESLLDEAVAKAREIVAANDDAKTDAEGNPAPELDQPTRERIAEAVGIGGIKYADLNHNRESDYVFDWDKMLAKNGDTATYMQYAYARIQGIFRKGNVDPAAVRDATQPILLKEAAERALALKLCRFGEALESVAAESRPNLLTQYLFELANQLTTFYDQCPVLKAEDEALRLSRLRLVDLSGRVIRHGLGLLGIETCERM